MCKRWFAAVLFCFVCPLLCAQTDCKGQGQIEGSVMDNEGKPVASAKVSILPEQCAVIGIEPTAMTDMEGHFVLSHAPVGLTGVFAQKPEASYPDTTAAIYGDDSAPIPKVIVRSGEVVSG